MTLGSSQLGHGVSGNVTSTETVVQIGTMFGLPDDPLVLPALTRGQLFFDFDKRPEGTKVIPDATVGEE